MFEIHSSKLQPNKFLSLFGFKVKTRRHKVLPVILHKNNRLPSVQIGFKYSQWRQLSFLISTLLSDITGRGYT